MKVYIYGYDKGLVAPIVACCAGMVEAAYTITQSMYDADIAVAPLLTEILPMEKILLPAEGTLVFHPSLLPRHRGADAIKWAFKLKEVYSGVTWFWPDEGIDTGDICEQEVLAIREGEAPKDYYMRAVIPAAVRTLERALKSISAGYPRRVPQIKENGSYEPRLNKM